MSEKLLEVDDLTIQYETREGMVTAVSNASFSIDAGKYFGLVGESGCGKSTIAKAIIGALDDNGTVTNGSIKYKGTDISALDERKLNEEIRWKEISWIPQASMNSLDPIDKIGDQAVEIAQVHTDMSPEEARERFADALEVVGLSEERIDDYPFQFSGGMQQRAIIALAIFLEPRLLIADEPTTALDVIMQDQIFKYIEDIQDELGTSMMLITHDISLVFESCSEMAVMHSGQISEVGTVEDIYDSPRHPYTILLQNAFPDVRYPDRSLDTIEGHPPKQIGEVSSCTFAERCPWATRECKTGAPPLEAPSTAANEGQKVACFRDREVYEETMEEDR